MVFFIAVERYWERNVALRRSSRQGINHQVKNIFDYMEMEHAFNGLSPYEEGGNMLEYFVAGDEHWAKSSRDQQRKRSGVCHSSFVTTADVERELAFSSAVVTRWACWLTVASASSKAYLRRFIGLARAEQFIHQVRMRKIWFQQRLATSEWLHYMHIEQEFLYNYLYTKSTDPERHLIQLWLRILESLALVAALVLIYVYAQTDTWLDRHSYKVVTYVLLVAGFVVEVVYVLRLFFSKGAVVAMLVTLVRTQRAAQQCYPWARKLHTAKVRVTRLACAGVLHISMFMDPIFHNNRQYVPRFVSASRAHRLLKMVGISVTHSQRGWDMFCLTLPKGVAHEGEIHKVQEGQSDALEEILELISLIAQSPTNRQDEPAKAPSCMPGHSPLCCNTFLPFCSKDWEHVLVTWFIATLKLLRLERLQLEAADVCEPVDDIEFAASIKVDDRVASNCNEPVELSTSLTARNGAINGTVDNIPSVDNYERARNKAVWAMMYVCRLLTTIPELLPTQLDYTKELVELEFAEAELDITDMKRWVDKTMEEVAQWSPPEPITFKNQIGMNSSSTVEYTGYAYRHHNHENPQEYRFSDVFHCSRASRYVTVMLFNLDPASRWEVVASSACWFIAALAQSLKVEEHSTRLTRGGELLTTLWMLSSHLGGGVQ